MPASIPESRILEATLEVWREEGYRSATTRKIAERAAVGEVTLFRRFGAKSDLFTAALAHESARMGNLQLVYTGEAEHDILLIATAYTQLVERNATIMLDFLQSAPDSPELSAVGTVPLRVMTELAEIIQRHQAAGTLRGGTPYDLLVSLLSPILMKRLLTKAQPGIPLANDVHADVQFFLCGYGQLPTTK
ncbi:hypothetical protein BJG92_03081 [Arthrobacter sp. SO5]|uniref:TetR/AcrR family transcriptional regulator n=1 Tax=Arthrobacter sp. SO5 TaxID=1897055 RepID=UPI001E37C102|nr:TetR/AcrR family transcriptional regulator [Arthrobacter sp. SO5]MCB5275530.1 hypothetical protein [Arthrobacter sp. SO5]